MCEVRMESVSSKGSGGGGGGGGGLGDRAWWLYSCSCRRSTPGPERYIHITKASQTQGRANCGHLALPLGAVICRGADVDAPAAAPSASECTVVQPRLAIW